MANKQFKNGDKLLSSEVINTNGVGLDILLDNYKKPIKGGFSIGAGETYNLEISIANTAIIDLKGTGSNVECGILYYVHRTNKYYCRVNEITHTQYMSTYNNLNIQTSSGENTVNFVIINNNQSTINIDWAMYLLH